MARIRRSKTRVCLASASLLALAACADGFDVDMRDLSGGLDTTEATRLATEPRPQPDSRGVITYPNFQVALAERGDTISGMANRLGLNAAELARYNGIAAGVPLREGEVIALPRRIDGTVVTGGTDDIASLATGALDRVDGGNRNRNSTVTTTTLDAAPSAPSTPVAEPVRHKVTRGETAYSIARLYKVSVRALSEWNGLGPEMNVREGQVLLIPVASDSQPSAVPVAVEAPGVGSLTPEPPSASQPLPEEVDVASVAPPPSPGC